MVWNAPAVSTACGSANVTLHCFTADDGSRYWVADLTLSGGPAGANVPLVRGQCVPLELHFIFDFGAFGFPPPYDVPIEIVVIQ